jgi:hypothetical protein
MKPINTPAGRSTWFCIAACLTMSAFTVTVWAQDCKLVGSGLKICTQAGALASGHPLDCNGECDYWNQTTYSDTCNDCYSYDYSEDPNTGMTKCGLTSTEQWGTQTSKNCGTVLGICICLPLDPNKFADWYCDVGSLSGDDCDCPWAW